MDPLSILIISGLIGLVVWAVISIRRRKVFMAYRASLEDQLSERESAERFRSSSVERDLLIEEVAKVRIAISAFVIPLLIWATFSLVAGLLMWIGLIEFLDDPSGFSSFSGLLVAVGGFVHLFGFSLAVAFGWRLLRKAHR